MGLAKQNSDKAKLKQLCVQILEEERPIRILETTRALYQLLCLTAGIDENNAKYQNDLITPSGKAIAPLWAAMCINDFLRTQRFFRGIYQAVLDLKRENPGEKIHILYAGTGPFATMALPIMSLFSKDEVSFTLLEIQETSVYSLNKILKYFDLQEYVLAIIQTDASSFHLEKPYNVHIVISEVMQHALEKEPQVEITLNLSKQVNEKTIWIPQDVKIDVSLMNMTKDNESQLGLLPDYESSYIDIGTLFHLDKETFKNIKKQLPLSDKVQHVLPTATVKSHPWLVLMTTIHIYGDQYLLPLDSGLCAPRLLTDLSQHSKKPTKVECWYKTGSSPGFEYKLLY